MEINKIHVGDCLIKLKELGDNSVDSIVTDPPYELGFMGKSWDNTGIANNKEMWAECLRVLKPGGHLLAFSGTRTYHRMASTIEDAGFEVRDMIEWVYGCLSFDTEVLTERGFRRLHKLTQYDRIAVYDTEKNIYKWERPQRWNIYQVHEDTAYRIKSDYTDQIVSRNHRCLVEREGKLVFIQAEELNNLEYMPTLQSDFFTLQKRYWKLLLSDLLWKGKELAKGYWTPWEKRLDRKKYGELSNKNDWREKSSVERWSNLFQKTRKLQTNKVCAMSEAVFADGTKRWLCDGTSFDFSKLNGALPIENGSGASHQPQSTGQSIGKSDVIQIKQGTQITRRARVEKIEYSGIIFCPTVSTGAFVARRNGQVFITGNSGFPKSRNIGLDVDKRNGVTKNRGKAFVVAGQSGQKDKDTGGDLVPGSNTMGAYVAQNEWSGWGTALKPAHEPICMARKHLEAKTVAENCLKYGTGGINIDESRVGKVEGDRTEYGRGHDLPHANTTNSLGKFNKVTAYEPDSLGRFPANLIHDNSEEVRECFPETNSKWGKSSGVDVDPDQCSSFKIGLDGQGIKERTNKFTGDSGNASRFFKSINISGVGEIEDTTVGEDYRASQKAGTPQRLEATDGASPSLPTNFKSIIYQAKASKSERNKGCEELEEKEQEHSTNMKCANCGLPVLSGTGISCKCENKVEVRNKLKNFHPTVKPIALMEYLIKMVTPKGGIVLDPFAGSGSTLVAAKQNGYNYIGIEMTEEYIPIIEARLKAISNTLF